MWVCIEIQTDNLEIWGTVDRLLSTELGCTHIIWGVRKEENNKPVACKLPSNLFHAEPTEKESEFKARISELLEPLELNYNIIVMGNSWSHSYESPKAKSSYVEDKEIVTREA